MTTSRQFNVRVRRYNPEDGRKPRWQTFQLESFPGMTVLQALQAIRETRDASLAWRHSCRMGVCGSCAMVINGTPGLACNTQVEDLSGKTLRLESLWNFDIVKDLVVSLDPMFEKHRALKPYVIRRGSDAPPSLPVELQQLPEQLTEFLQFTSCIKCGACMAACPTVASDDHFAGPMPLTAMYRYNADSRDDGFAERKAMLDDFHGPVHCHYAAECSRVCPKGVDPARAIQLMKRDLVKDMFGSKRPAPAAPLTEPQSGETGKAIPNAPQRTVSRESPQ